LTDKFEENIKSFKQSLKGQSGVENICLVTETPGKQIYWDAGGIFKVGENENSGKNYQIVGVDYDFVDVFDVKFVCGRNFNKEFPSDKEALILNEKAVQWMGFENPQTALNKQVSYWGQIFNVIGVLKNYHQQSLKAEFEPHLYRFMPQGRRSLGVFAMKISSGNISETIAKVRSAYNQFFPGNTFDYYFLDEYFNQQYQNDEKFGRVFGIFSFLTIIIAVLGILGLSAFMAVQRTKEIGIRKVLGASISRILLLLSRDFLVLILVSFIISLPVAIWGINYWLESFAKKMEPDPVLFFIPLLIIGFVTIITISTNVIKASLSNPVESLRYE